MTIKKQIKIIDRFLDEGLINDAADIFQLKIDDIKALERFGEQSAKNLVTEAAAKKEITLQKFIYALGILHVGEETAIALSSAIASRKLKVESPKNLLDNFINFSLDELQSIPDIGPKVSESIVNWFKEKRNIDFIKKLDSVGIRIQPYNLLPKTYNLPLAGQSFVLTGTLSSMTRDDAKAKIRSLGGDISESVSKKTSYVVAGENPGSKHERAKKLGMKILNETTFIDLLKSVS